MSEPIHPADKPHSLILDDRLDELIAAEHERDNLAAQAVLDDYRLKKWIERALNAEAMIAHDRRQKEWRGP